MTLKSASGHKTGISFYNHKKAVIYCGSNIFLIRALYSAAIPLSVVELIGVAVGVPLTVLFLSGGNYFGLVIAAAIVNSIVFFPAVLVFIAYKLSTAECVAEIVTALNGPPITVLRGACPAGVKDTEFLELVNLLIKNNHIKDYSILRGALLVKNSISLSEKEINEYLGLSKKINGGKGFAKKIVYELPDTGADEFCDNCGKSFEKDNSFCGYCGTMRKNLRRRI